MRALVWDSPARVVRAREGASALVLVAAGYAVAHGQAVPVLAVGAVAAALVVGIRSWRWSVYGLIAYLPVSGVAIIASYPHTQSALLIKDALFVVPAYVGFATAAIAARRNVLFDGAVVVPIAVVVLLVLGQAFNPNTPNVLFALIGIKVWLLYIPLYLLGYHFIRTRDDVARVLRLMVTVAIVPLGIGIIEALLVYGGQSAMVYRFYGQAAAAATQQFAQFNYSDGSTLRRIPSTFSFVTQYFVFTATMVAVGFAWWRFGGQRRRTTFFAPLMWCLMIGACYLSGARGAFLMLPALVLIIFLLDQPRRIFTSSRLALPSAAFLGSVTVFGTAAPDVLARALNTAGVELNDLVIRGFRDAFHMSWLGLGTGFDTNATRYAFSNASGLLAVRHEWWESWWVKSMLELGLAGLIAVLVLFGVLVTRGIRAQRHVNDRELRAVSAALLAYLIWLLIYNLKGQYVDLDPANVYFWLFAGFLAKVQQLGRVRPHARVDST